MSNDFDKPTKSTPMLYPLSKRSFNFSSKFIKHCCVVLLFRKHVGRSGKGSLKSLVWLKSIFSIIFEALHNTLIGG